MPSTRQAITIAREFGCFIVEDGRARPVAHRAHWQPLEYNALHGGLDGCAAQVMRELRGGMLQDARGKVRENVFFSLLVALGLGFIVGVLFNGPGRGK